MNDAYLNSLIEEIQSRGLSLAAVFETVPRHASAIMLGRALRRTLELCGDPGLAISYGLRLNLASHGTLGYALMSSRNGDQLLSLLSRYAALAVPGLVLRRIVEGNRLLLACETSAGELPREFVTELVLTTLVNGAKALFNRRIPGAQIWLDFAVPAHVDRYVALGVPAQFSQSCSALVCDRAFLDMPLSSANPVMSEIGTRQCESLLLAMRERAGTAQLVRREFLRTPGQFPDQHGMAARLRVSTRTLRRRLDLEGTSFREVIDELRFELAKRYLHAPELRVAEIAGLIGYDEAANFRRAFRRWSGMSPQNWREGISENSRSAFDAGAVSH